MKLLDVKILRGGQPFADEVGGDGNAIIVVGPKGERKVPVCMIPHPDKFGSVARFILKEDDSIIACDIEKRDIVITHLGAFDPISKKMEIKCQYHLKGDNGWDIKPSVDYVNGIAAALIKAASSMTYVSYAAAA